MRQSGVAQRRLINDPICRAWGAGNWLKVLRLARSSPLRDYFEKKATVRCAATCI